MYVLKVIPVILSLIGALCNVSDVFAATVRLGTATPGGGFQLYGQHLAEVMNASDASLNIEVIATRGSTQNLADLEAGKLDIGLVEGNAARDALEGIGREPAKLKVLAVMYPNPGMFVVRGDSPYRTIADLQGKPVAFGTRVSGLRILANDVLEGLGLNPVRDFEQVILEQAADGPRLVLENKVVALWGAGIGWPGFVAIADSPGGARFIAPDAAQIEKIRARHPHLRPMRVPANTYTGQAEAIQSVGLWSLILVREDLDAELVFQLTRALHLGEAALAEQLAQGQYSTLSNTQAEIPRERLHPGTVRFHETLAR